MADDDNRKNPETPGSVKDPEKKRVSRHLIRPRWLRITLKTLMWILVAIILIPVLLYVQFTVPRNSAFRRIITLILQLTKRNIKKRLCMQIYR